MSELKVHQWDQTAQSWFDEPDALGQLKGRNSVHPEFNGYLRKWIDDGYFIVDDLVKPKNLDDLVADVSDIWNTDTPRDGPLINGVSMGGVYRPALLKWSRLSEQIFRAKMKFVVAIMAALIATPSVAQPDKSNFVVLDALARYMSWTITNSTGENLSLGFYSQVRDHEWAGYTLNNNSTQIYKLTCQSGEQICYGATVSDGNWGVGSGDHPCTKCCWLCGEANPSVNLTP